MFFKGTLSCVSTIKKGNLYQIRCSLQFTHLGVKLGAVFILTHNYNDFRIKIFQNNRLKAINRLH